MVFCEFDYPCTSKSISVTTATVNAILNQAFLECSAATPTPVDCDCYVATLSNTIYGQASTRLASSLSSSQVHYSTQFGLSPSNQCQQDASSFFSRYASNPEVHYFETGFSAFTTKTIPGLKYKTISTPSSGSTLTFNSYFVKGTPTVHSTTDSWGDFTCNFGATMTSTMTKVTVPAYKLGLTVFQECSPKRTSSYSSFTTFSPSPYPTGAFTSSRWGGYTSWGGYSSWGSGTGYNYSTPTPTTGQYICTVFEVKPTLVPAEAPTSTYVYFYPTNTNPPVSSQCQSFFKSAVPISDWSSLTLQGSVYTTEKFKVVSAYSTNVLSGGYTNIRGSPTPCTTNNTATVTDYVANAQQPKLAVATYNGYYDYCLYNFTSAKPAATRTVTAGTDFVKYMETECYSDYNIYPTASVTISGIKRDLCWSVF